MPQPQHAHAQIARSRAPIPTGQRAPLQQEQRDPYRRRCELWSPPRPVQNANAAETHPLQRQVQDHHPATSSNARPTASAPEIPEAYLPRPRPPAQWNTMNDMHDAPTRTVAHDITRRPQASVHDRLSGPRKHKVHAVLEETGEVLLAQATPRGNLSAHPRNAAHARRLRRHHRRRTAPDGRWATSPIRRNLGNP